VSSWLRFLIVEDVDLLRVGLVSAFGAHGRAVGVGTVAEARDALRQQRFDSCVVDVSLPDGNGLDLVSLALQRWPSICVLVLTGSTDHAVIARCHELGVRYLLKPFDPEQIRVHANEARARREVGDRRIAVALDRWKRGHGLTRNETELLELGARGVPREEFEIIRGVRTDTIKKQIQTLLTKTGDNSFEAAVNSLLREAVAEPR
jgi:DNA-binding NarL/FixJ family response regulator